jgi:hypothetical protein
MKIKNLTEINVMRNALKMQITIKKWDMPMFAGNVLSGYLVH